MLNSEGEPRRLTLRPLPELHEEALDHTRSIVHGIGAEQLELSTPCDDYDVRTLLNHVVSGNFWVAPLVEGKSIDDVGDLYDGDVIGSDPASAYDESADVAAAAFKAPGAMDRPVAVSYGPVPGEVYAGHRYIDVLIHGWDLAVGTSQETKLPPELVDACIEIIEPQIEMLEGSGAFGTKVEVGADANAQTRLLAMLGRRG
jgi:uncharacterized protein (TIGR03086 family)